MREIDATADAPIEALIDRAGRQVAFHARKMMGGVYGRRVVALAGPGNNGADARVAAQLLARWGAQTAVFAPDVREIPAADLVIDGAFGTGVSRPYSPPVCRAPVLAVDIPSGVDGLTGELLGSAIAAQKTVTFAALKPGLLLHPGAARVGDIEVVEIGLDTSPAQAWLLTESTAARWLPRPKPNDHKWNRSVWVIGGSSGMFGAPMLAAQAALRSGGGIAWCSLPGQAPPSMASEIVFTRLSAAAWHDQVLESAHRFGALVVGPGIGRAPEAARSVQQLVRRATVPMVIDGDALRLLGDRPKLRPGIVLTPHDGEYEALAGHRPGPDRFAAARLLAAATGATVLLKGPLTVVGEPSGLCIATNRGDARLATAGTGDVLAGMIGSYLAAGLVPGEAASLAAWVHGEAGRRLPTIGAIASDLLTALPVVSASLVDSVAASRANRS